MKNEKIYIIGYGAIGKALATFLTGVGKNVVAVRGSVDDGSITHDSVAVQLANGNVIEQKIEVVTLKAIDKIEGLIVLATKSFGNSELSKTLKPIAGNTPIVVLQNGLNVERAFLENGFTNVYRCVLLATSQILESGVVRFRPVADSPIGIIKGDAATLNNVITQIDSEYFRFRAEENILPVIWKKTIINTVFNSVCPLLNADNGIFYKEPSAFQLAKRLIAAGIAIAEKSGVSLSQQEVETSLIDISKASDGQLISTLQDINNGRTTEIETLNFEILRIAKQEGVADISGEIALLGELIKIKEQLYKIGKGK